MDDRPLKILVVYLTPGCQELSPIEIIFHALNRHVRRFCEDSTTEAAEVLKTAREVMDGFTFNLIKKQL